jgi:DNA-binding MarR family transcriptional regulator
VLLAFTLEFERQSAVSLAICANVLRLFEGEPIKVRDLPRLSGVSKEAIAIATGFLRARGFAAIEADSGARRGKVVRLTPAGTAARNTYARLLGEIEASWQTRFGEANLRNLRDALERLTNMRDGEELLLFKGMEPYADNWRAKVPSPSTLPHYPMVLHRGGYPDGS